jgi:hypothetical protein
MTTRVACLVLTSWRSLAHRAMLAVLPVLASPLAWAQTPNAPQNPSARRQELRSIVSQPQATPALLSAKAAEQHHLSPEERSQLRRQLAREIRAQAATQPDVSRP